MKHWDQKKRVCRCCGEHNAIFIFKGKAHADPDHDLCPRCFEREIDKLRSEQLVEAA